MSRSAVIAAYARSPFQPAVRGLLARTRPDELAAGTLRALVERSGVEAGDIEDVIVGCAFPEGEQGLNLARHVSLLAGLPIEIAAATVNRFCGSSMYAVHMAAGAIAMGAGEVFLCAGVESMTRVPIPGFNPMPHPKLAKEMPGAYMSMGETAENVAKRFSIDRARQEAFAAESHGKAAAARSAGKLDAEIIAMGDVTADGCIRPETTAEVLAGLDPAFLAGGTVTAGTSSPLTDGAAAVLVVSEELCLGAWHEAARTGAGLCRCRLCARYHGHGPRGGFAQGVEARRARHGRYRHRRDQRGLRLTIARLHGRA